MKRLTFFVPVFILLLFVSCSQKKEDSTTVRIVFPQMDSPSQRIMASADGTISTSLWSGSINEFSQINCYAIMIGGLEELHRRNYCNEKGTEQRLVNFGNYYGALAPENGQVEIEVAAQVERQLTIVGMSSQDGTCPRFQGHAPPPGWLSHPRILHQKTYIFEIHDQELIVEMPASFDATVPEIDHCQFDSEPDPSTGTNTPASLSFALAADHDYGLVAVGGFASTVLTLTNSGDLAASPLSFASLTLPFRYAGGAFPGTGGNCATELAGQTSCFLEIEYAPTDMSASDTLQILATYEDGSGQNQQVTRGLAGSAANPASLSISESDPYNFGTVVNGASTSHLFTIANSGGITATSLVVAGLGAPYDFVGGSFPGTGGNCTSTLAPASSCLVDIVLSPTAAGTHNDTMTASYNDGVSSQSALRSLTGMSVTPATLTISHGATYDFGATAIGGTVTHSFIVSNGGGAPATSMSGTGLATPYTFLGGGYPGTGGDCGGTLAPAGTCTIVVQYAPSGIGTHNDTIDINYNDGASVQVASRDVTGTGAAPAVLSISESDPYNYGSITSATTASHTFTITNSGGVPATTIHETGLASPYNFKGGTFPGTGGTCSPTLATSANCTIVVDFTPPTGGTYNDSIDINYLDGAGAQVSSRSVTGTGL